MSLPATVQAITIAKHGGFEVLEKTAQPLVVEPDHIVVKTQFLGVNFIDTYHRAGLYPSTSFPMKLGKEAAGVIVGLPTDPNVLKSEDYKKQNYNLGDAVALETLGAHADHVSLPWKSVYPLPASVSTKTAAAGLLQGLTALTFMTESYNVDSGDNILIHTIAGGLGLIMAQIAKSRGATVIGTTSTLDKAKLAKANGADHVILYKDEDVVKRVLEITNGEGVDAIFDGVGKDTFESNFLMIKRKGTIVSAGNASGAVPPFAPLKLAPKNIKLLRPAMNNYLVTPAENYYYGHALFLLIAKGTIKINIHSEYPFTAQGVQDAQKDLMSGQTAGKLVIKITDN